MSLYALLVAMTFMGAVAALFLKKSCANPGLFSIMKAPSFYLGGGLYFITALINIYLLKFMDYSIVLPFTALTYVWSTLLSARFLHEKVSKKQMAGLALIVIGVCLLVST